MKYLKRIFERLTEDQILELREECETYLAYLLDEDFIIEMIADSTFSCMDIDIRKSEFIIFKCKPSADDDQFLWNDIKDHVIPLIELFRKGHFKYKLEKVILYFAYGSKSEIRNDEDLDKVQTSGFKDELICLTIKIKI
jgi:hypothetical protein